MAKRSQQLFEYLVRIAENAREASVLFVQGLQDLSDTGRFADQVKAFESKGDELASGLVNLLHATYITPLDREDFLELAMKMDDIVDQLEACAVRFHLFHITQATPAMLEFARNIQDCVNEVTAAVERLHARKLAQLRAHTVRINELEKTGDELLRNSLRALFSEGHADVLEVIKLKEIYEILESVTDRCQDVGDVLASVSVKNA
ncbi:MAG: DUF47 domain-containing protein [Alicyclobacillaceae bacterium]|nr:DUF47 domain-containing protein [Alicyclobacillaceae bacterium]